MSGFCPLLMTTCKKVEASYVPPEARVTLYSCLIPILEKSLNSAQRVLQVEQNFLPRKISDQIADHLYSCFVQFHRIVTDKLQNSIFLKFP